MPLFEVPETGIERVHHVRKRHAARAVIAGCFGKRRGGRDGVLIARVTAREASVALLKAEEILVCPLAPVEFPAVFLFCRLEAGDLLPDILEARQRLDLGDAVVRGERSCHIRRDDGRDERAVLPALRQEPELRFTRQQIFRNEDAAHVAREGAVFPALFLHIDAEAVGVGVGGEHKIGVLLLRKREREREGGAVFGIGIFERREVPVGRFLFGHDEDLLEAELFQDPSHGQVARAVQGRVDDLDVLRFLLKRFGAQNERLDGGKVRSVHLFPDRDEEPARLRFLFGDAPDVFIRDGIHEGDDALVVGRHDLAAVRKIHFIAVVFGRVVARRDDDARRCLQVPDGEGEHGRGAQALEEVRLHAVGGEDARRIVRKFFGTAAAVVSDDDAPVPSLGVEERGKALGRSADGIFVHAVAARTQNAPQPSRSEGKVAVKAVFDLLLVGKRRKFALGIFVKDGG